MLVAMQHTEVCVRACVHACMRACVRACELQSHISMEKLQSLLGMCVLKTPCSKCTAVTQDLLT